MSPFDPSVIESNAGLMYLSQFCYHLRLSVMQLTLNNVINSEWIFFVNCKGSINHGWSSKDKKIVLLTFGGYLILIPMTQ